MGWYQPSVQTIHHHCHFFPHTSQISYLKYGLLPPSAHCSSYSPSLSFFTSHITNIIFEIWLVTTLCSLLKLFTIIIIFLSRLVTTSQLCSNYLPSSSFFSLTSLQLPDQPLAVTLLVTFLLQEGSLWSQKLGLELFLPLVILPCNSTPHPPTH